MVKRLFLLLAALAAIPAAPAPAMAESIDAAAVARALQSVVVVLPIWQGVRPGFAPRTNDRRIAPEGSGLAILKGGYIATNDHVLGNTVAVNVRLADGRTLPARIVGRDKATDIALLKIGEDLPLLTPAGEMRVAEPVCAIGNPFGRGLSVSCGVVSAVGRSNAGFNAIEDFVQTDAAVNPGNSGGALVDGQGQLAGMVSAIFAAEPGMGAGDSNIGVNFATSVRLLRRVVVDLKENGQVLAGAIGLEVGPLSAQQNARAAGVAVVQVTGDGPALRAGIEAGDILTAIAAEPVTYAAQVRARLFLYRPGDKVTLSLLRAGQPRAATVTFAPAAGPVVPPER